MAKFQQGKIKAAALPFDGIKPPPGTRVGARRITRLCVRRCFLCAHFVIFRSTLTFPKNMPFSRRLAWSLLPVLFFTALPAPAYAATDSPQSSDNQSEVVELDPIEIFAIRYYWRYARTPHFEILSDWRNDAFVSDITRTAEHIISVFEKNCSLFRMNRELPVKLILIENQGIQRFLSSVGSSMGARMEMRSRFIPFAPKITRPDGGATIIRETRLGRGTTSRRNDEQWVFVVYMPQEALNNERHIERSAQLTGVDLALQYLGACVASQNANTASHLAYAFTRPKMLTLDATERNKVRTNRPERIAPELCWISTASDGILLQRHDMGREQELFRNESADYPKPGQKDYKALKAKADSEFLAKPRLTLGEVLEQPGAFRIEPGRTGTMQSIELGLSYRRQIADFSFYCAFAPDPKIREAYASLLRNMKKHPLTEDVFKNHFGKDYARFHEEIYSHYRKLSETRRAFSDNAWGNPSVKITGSGIGAQIKPVKFRKPTRAESARIISDWFLVNDSLDLALETLRRVDRADAKFQHDPEFAAALGICEAMVNDKEQALALLEKAFAGESARPEAHRLLAKLRLENMQISKGPDWRLLAPEVESVFAPLAAALAHPRCQRSTFFQAAKLWELTDEKPPATFLKLLADGCLRHPDDFPVLNAVIPLLRQNGLPALADDILDATARCTLTPEETFRLEELRNAASPAQPVSPPEENQAPGNAPE